MKKKLLSVAFVMLFSLSAFAKPELWTIKTSCGGTVTKYIDSEATQRQIYDSIQAANVADCGYRAKTVTITLAP